MEENLSLHHIGLHSGNTLRSSLCPQSEDSAAVQCKPSQPLRPQTHRETHTVLSEGCLQLPKGPSQPPATDTAPHSRQTLGTPSLGLLTFCSSSTKLVSFLSSSRTSPGRYPGDSAASKASFRAGVCGALDRFFLLKIPELHRGNKAQSQQIKTHKTRCPGDLKGLWQAPNVPPSSKSQWKAPLFSLSWARSQRAEWGALGAFNRDVTDGPLSGQGATALPAGRLGPGLPQGRR